MYYELDNDRAYDFHQYIHLFDGHEMQPYCVIDWKMPDWDEFYYPPLIQREHLDAYLDRREEQCISK